MIKLDDNYTIRAIPHNIILEYEGPEKKILHKGEEIVTNTKDKWFLPTVKAALLKYCHIQMGESSDVSDLIGRIEKLEVLVNSKF